MTNDSFINLLVVDYKKSGNLRKIICPYHDDRNPSLIVYPTKDKGFWCPVCGSGGHWTRLYKDIKGCSWSEAFKKLGENTTCKAKIYRPPFEFCSEPKHVALIQSKYKSCPDLEPDAREFLKSKHLLSEAILMGWKSHTGQFKCWGKGIVIPYYEDGEVVYCRFRPYRNGKFERPISLPGIESRPYIALNMGRNYLYLCEGETDALTLYAQGESAISTPGCMVKKCINTSIKLAEYYGYKIIVAAGDNDIHGQKMNSYIKDTAGRISRIKVEESLPVTKDWNEDYAAVD